MHSKLIFALTLSAALSAPLALHGKALATSPRPVSQAAAPTLGMAIMSAIVDKDGNLTGGAGAVGASREYAGQYFVVFNRSVEGCTHVAAIGGPTLYPGFVSTMSNPGMFNGATYYGVTAFSRDPDRAARDRSFHLTVFCSK